MIKEHEDLTKTEKERASKAEEFVASIEEEKQVLQSEMDDFLLLFGDMEEKVTQYKMKMKALGETVSDGEGDSDEHEEAEEDEDLDEVD